MPQTLALSTTDRICRPIWHHFQPQGGKEYTIYMQYTYTVNTFSRAGIFERVWGPGINSKEWIPPAYVAWRAGTITGYSYSVPSPHRLFKNSSSGLFWVLWQNLRPVVHNHEKPHTTPYHSLIYISTYHWVRQQILSYLKTRGVNC